MIPKVMELVTMNLNSEHPFLGQGSLDELLKREDVKKEASPGWDRRALCSVTFCYLTLLCGLYLIRGNGLSIGLDLESCKIVFSRLPGFILISGGRKERRLCIPINPAFYNSLME